jgi:hypothetical protein
MKHKRKTKKDVVDILNKNVFRKIYVWYNTKQNKLKCTSNKFESNINEYWDLVGETTPPSYKYYGHLYDLEN